MRNSNLMFLGKLYQIFSMNTQNQNCRLFQSMKSTVQKVYKKTGEIATTHKMNLKKNIAENLEKKCKCSMFKY